MLGMRSKVRMLRSSDGQTLVEFAFILPLMLLLILGIMEFGMIMYDKAVITNACREGARHAIAYRASSSGDYAPLTDNEITQIVNNYTTGRLINAGSQPIAVTVTPGEGSRTEIYRGNQLTVLSAFDYNYLFLSPFAPALGDSLNLGARSIMRME